MHLKIVHSKLLQASIIHAFCHSPAPWLFPLLQCHRLGVHCSASIEHSWLTDCICQITGSILWNRELTARRFTQVMVTSQFLKSLLPKLHQRLGGCTTSACSCSALSTTSPRNLGRVSALLLQTSMKLSMNIFQKHLSLPHGEIQITIGNRKQAFLCIRYIENRKICKQQLYFVWFNKQHH